MIEELPPRLAGLMVGSGTRSDLCVVVDSS